MNRLPSRFELITNLSPILNDKNEIIELYPHLNFINSKNYTLLDIGSGPFCKFTIPKENNKEGVYAIVVSGIIKYIGECQNLSDRFNSGYGNISPRNCYVGGQSTNCKVNRKILESFKASENVQVYFLESISRKQIESELIELIQPDWNDKGVRSSIDLPIVIRKKIKNEKNKTVKGSDDKVTGKYKPLDEYFKVLEGQLITLSLREIENILKDSLPKSALTYKEWWANGGHYHAESWLRHNWIVDELALGKYVRFKRI